MRPPGVVLALLLLGTACSVPARDAARQITPPATPVTPPAMTAPGTPLVLAVHPIHQALHVPLSTARAVINGQVRDWRTLGAAPGRLRVVGGPTAPAAAAVAAVQRDPATLAVVPASAIGPGLRTLRVNGRDPIREPGAYPLIVPGPAPGPVATVTVVGDLMLARRVGRAMAAAGDFAGPLRRTARRVAAADLTIGNLEGTLSRQGRPTQGDDSFGADPRVLAGLELAGFDVLSLANNHVGDYGPASLVETVRRVRGAGIVPFGAGADAAEAARPAIVERAGVRFGILGFNAIGETPRAGPTTPGAVTLRMQPRLGTLNRTDLRAVTGAIQALRPRVDVLMVLPHWGAQYTSRTVADQRTVARALVDAGADLVIGGHPHVVQGVELHRGRLIAYSLGNYVFDMNFSRATQEGVILELTLWGGTVKAAELVPVRIDAAFAPRVLSAAAGRSILQRIWDASGRPFSAGS